MKQYLRQFVCISLFFLAVAVTYAQQSYFPDAEWQTKKPQELKMNAATLDSAVALALRSENKVERDLRIANIKSYSREPGYKIIGPMKERGGPAGLVIKNGYIVAQWGDVNRVDMTFSVTKSYLSTVAGLAVDQGLIKNVTDKVGQYVWDESFEGPHNAKITWQHLLTQSSDWSGSLFGLHDWADRPPKEGSIDDWKNRKLLEPGTNYEYNDVRVNLLAYSLLQVWRKPLPIVLKEKIMDPIGASTTWRWFGYENSYVTMDGLTVQSVSGGGHHGGGIFINTYDHARFGLLFLRNGKWKNQQLLSEKWIAAIQQPSAANKNYGYLWWLNTEQNWKGISASVYYAVGFGGNYIIVDKEHDLVVVARWLDDSKVADVLRLIIQSAENK
ncbi:CubicO group peptidase (beta-lactamase class C family) [Lacibacter cauensis]|uniref:CubicO group peptidase (Beta-lactamase class C family) n=1 Tax=Lacibacter cauensis TaxID=510947 RepID=A0A562SP71_9BACT|nr:serine hydrolase [Lacibacter cauensis]TWI83085.1 CubicO group peptidase (beta-lactamase class C family) [Lacibacter cauensis]